MKAPPAAQPDAEGPDRRRRLLILVICSLSLFITYVDTTVLNVALPAIARYFHAGVEDLQWITDAYLLVLASLLVAAGSSADRFGRKKLFSAGLLIFTGGSLLCSLAPSVGALVAFRMVQAFGGCMLTPVSLSIVRHVFTDPAERAQALGIWSGIFGLGAACGPILGGVLVTGVGWRSVFWINVPVGLAALAMARRYVPESKAPRARRLDPAGQVLVAALLGSLTYAIIEGPAAGWGSGLIIALFVVAATSVAALLAVEGRRRDPLIELRFFRSPTFSAANTIAVASFLVLAGFLFVNTLYLQEVRGYSPLIAGLSILPATALIAVSAPVGGFVVATYGPRLPLAVGSLCVAGGAAVLLFLTPTTPYSVLAASYVLFGVGFGVINPPITNTAVTGMPTSQAGVASAIASTTRQVGNVLGVAVMGAMVTGASSRTGRLRGHGKVAFTAATHLPWALAVGCGLLCAAIAVAFTGPWGRRVAGRVHTDPVPASP